MYITVNGVQYTCSRRKTSKNTIKYLSVKPEPEEISGIIKLYRDDGFLLAEDNADNYERKTYVGTCLTVTNEPEVEPVVAEPSAEALLTALLGVSENKMAAALSLRDSMEQITSLVHTETTQSDKLGYNWVETYVGDILAKKEYIE